MASFLKFIKKNSIPNSKTERWAVISEITGAELGSIQWWEAWRKYVFMPSANTIFDNKYLSEIISFIENERERN